MKITLAYAIQQLSALAFVLLVIWSAPLQVAAKSKGAHTPFAATQAVQFASPNWSFEPAPRQPMASPKPQFWLASNVDSAYLAGVRDGRYASLNAIKSAIQAYTGVPVKRVLSIAMANSILVLTIEDTYSNIFTLRLRPETAEILP